MYFGYNALLDSPPFTKTPTLAVGETKNFDFMFKDTSIEPVSKYLPLNYMFVQNNSGSPVVITIKDVKYYVSTSAAIQLEESDIGAYTSFSITNKGNAAINQDELLITVQRRGISNIRDIVQGKIARGDYSALK